MGLTTGLPPGLQQMVNEQMQQAARNATLKSPAPNGSTNWPAVPSAWA
jgi:hypothetical protein